MDVLHGIVLASECVLLRRSNLSVADALRWVPGCTVVPRNGDDDVLFRVPGHLSGRCALGPLYLSIQIHVPIHDILMLRLSIHGVSREGNIQVIKSTSYEKARAALLHATDMLRSVGCTLRSVQDMSLLRGDAQKNAMISYLMRDAHIKKITVF